MTTGRINQVATSRCRCLRSETGAHQHEVRIVCVEFEIASLHKFRNCLVPRLRSSVCTCSVEGEAPPEERALLHQHIGDSISARNTAEPRYQMRLISVLNGWLKKATIDPYNSKTRAQVIQSRTSWHSMIKAKKKSEPGGSLIKHLLDVTRKRKTRNQRGCTKQRRKTILIKILFCRIPTKNFYLVLSSAS